MTTATGVQGEPLAGPSARTGDLALALQEAFTVAVRLRANRQVATDAASFRTHIKALLSGADRDARARGYDPEYVKLAIYAYIAFLDETVLNSSQPMFSEWTRQPLQEEIFGEHVAGENFFRYAGDLLGRHDSQELADLLEVYHLCILLGFRGRYGASDPGSLQGLTMTLQQKIARIRGARAGFSPAWMLPKNETVETAADPWIRKLVVFAGASVVFALVLYVLFRLMLAGTAADVRNLATQLVTGA